MKKMGYQTIELAGYGKGKIRDIELMDFKKMADDAGITILSSHVNPPVREYTKDNLNTIKEYWKKTADDHAKLGVKYLVQPGQPVPVTWKKRNLFVKSSTKPERS